MSNTQHFVSNNNIPEFIKSDFELFDTFVKAYYEWLDSQNDSENSNYADVYKAVGNPGYVVNNKEILTDIDETIDKFIDYFADEIVPISLEGIQSDPRFFLKKVRELYLAKGTVKSFKLFFKLYYNNNIDVFETRDTVLRASDGKFFSFPTTFFYITENADNLNKIDFTLAEIRDSDDNIGSILEGGLERKGKSGELIIKTQFTNEFTLKQNTNYYIKNANDGYQITVRALVSLSELTITDQGALYKENDPVYFDGQVFGSRFLGSIKSVTQGLVEGIKVRNRGVFYTANDYLQFVSGARRESSITINEVGNTGDVLKINNYDLRTGTTNNGYLAGTLEDVFVPITTAAKWSELPDVEYVSASSYSADGNGDPYLKTTSGGLGLQTIAVSNSIGQANHVSIDQETYFKDSDDVILNAPVTVILENNNLKKGDKIGFQYFGNDANYHPFRDDSESITIGISYYKEFTNNHPDASISTDSEVNRIVNIAIPYAFDSESFNWIYKNVELDSRTPSADFWQPFINFLDTESNINYRIIKQVGYNLPALDGGPNFDSDYDSEIDGGTAFVLQGDSDAIDGGPFEVVATAVEYLQIEYQGAFISTLEEFHLNKMQTIDSEILKLDIITVKGEPRILDNNEDSDVGKWVDAGYHGEVVSIDSNNKVAKIVALQNSQLPDQETIDDWSSDKYNIVKISKFKEGKLVEDHTLPLNNIVHQVSRVKFHYKTSVVSTLFQKFYNQDGFISSDYGGTIQDNYYYSDYSYRIKSTLPLQTWKEKFKTMLHPAGLVMTNDFTINTEVKGVVPEVDEYISDNFTTNLTFDMNQEYIDLSLLRKGITTDGIYYKANAFEAENLIDGTATALNSSSLSSITNLTFKQQSGNAWWDYEPIGWVKTSIDSEIGSYYSSLKDQYLNWDSDQLLNKYTTQDSDSNGNVANNYNHFRFYDGTRQDLFKNQSRIRTKLQRDIMISKVQFEDEGFNSFAVYDSDLPDDLFANFNDSDNNFRSIDYQRLKSDSDNRYFQIFKIPRTWDISLLKERDLATAMREDGSLVWDDSDRVYTDYEAYERKWNQINNIRSRNNEGYSIKGYNQYVDYSADVLRSKRRSKNPSITYDRKYSDINTPHNKDATEQDSVIWNHSYYDQINNTIVNKDYQNETYKDPQISMRGRRKRGR